MITLRSNSMDRLQRKDHSNKGDTKVVFIPLGSAKLPSVESTYV